MNKKRIAVVSGGFDPLHSGHIAYLRDAKTNGEQLIVLLNSDNWLINKKGKYFLPFNERKIILENLEIVDSVVGFKDDEKNSCINGLQDLKKIFPSDEIVFCNGGDRNKGNIPEMSLDEIKFVFGVGGSSKMNSSSKILKNWNYEREERRWGNFYNLYLEKNIKVKELVIKPNKGMSFQRHFFRNEIWFVSEGACKVNHSKTTQENKTEFDLFKEDIFQVKQNEWHQIINPYKEICKIIEIQYGEKVEETDIERLYFYDDKV